MVRECDAELRLTWIDFQDAMLGPRVYDLVALLMDSYQSFDSLFIERRLQEFSRERGLGTDAETTARLAYEFDLVTVQRKLKDAGRFVFLDRVNGNSSFLQYVEPTIVRARAALRRIAATAEPLRRLEGLLNQVLA
jgi:aminoglycoside/choline kinase family phosphotransferase